MINKKRCFWGIYLLIAASAFAATTHYVSLYGTNNSPYLNWADSATNVQWAVDATTEGDTVLVSNGTYYLTNQISITNAITTTSVNGREVTIIDGYNYVGKLVTNRCFSIAASGSVLDGFTITNGRASSGGGVYLTYGTIKSCSVVNNDNAATASSGYGAGIYTTYGVITNTIVKNNKRARYGCGIYSANAGTVYNCLITGNSNDPTGGPAGVELQEDSVMCNSTITSNTGFGVRHGGRSMTSNCIVSYNSNQGLYFYCTPYVSRARNCLVKNNGTYGVVVYDRGIIENCTIVSNNSGVFATNAALVYASFINTIIVDSTNGTNLVIDQNKVTFTNCCTTPAVSGGTGNITASPLFQNPSLGNYRLSNASPCINAGLYQSWMTGAVDLDGRPRIRYGTVDMGAYERIFNGGIYRFH